MFERKMYNNTTPYYCENNKTKTKLLTQKFNLTLIEFNIFQLSYW